jgi:hypothetical protein
MQCIAYQNIYFTLHAYFIQNEYLTQSTYPPPEDQRPPPQGSAPHSFRISGTIVTGYRLDDRGSIPGRGKGFYL